MPHPKFLPKNKKTHFHKYEIFDQMIEWKVNTMPEYCYPFINKVWLCKKAILSAVQHGGNSVVPCVV
jgi:hypothetical protein